MRHRRLHQAQEQVGGDISTVGRWSFRRRRLREQRVEVALPAAGEQIIVVDVTGANDASRRRVRRTR